MILPSNGGPQPSSRHVSEHGVSVVWKPLSRWITKGGKCSNLITSEFHHISSRLFILLDEPLLLFVLHLGKVAGVVERAALEMR